MIQEQREMPYDLIHELEKKAHEKKFFPKRSILMALTLVNGITDSH